MKITDEMLSAAAPKARELLLDSLPPEEALPEVQVSARFQTRMERLHRRWKLTRAAKTAARYLGRTAAVLLLLLGTASAGILTAAAVQGKALDLVRHIYDTYIVVESPSYPGRQLKYSALYPVELGYLPEDMDIAFSSLIQNNTRYSVALRPESVIRDGSYKGPQIYRGALCELRQQLILPDESFYLAYTTEGTEAETFTFQDYTAEIHTKGDMTTMRWFDENIYYELYGNIGVSELKKIAENLIFYK